MPIHATAIIDKHAEIDPSADIGPYAVIDGPVKIGPGTRVFPNAYLTGWTEIGANVQIHPSAVVGHTPQDFHFKGERSYCRIGDGTIIRESASIHRGTQPESWTVVGKNCFILGFAHLGHNCELADGVKVYNGTVVAGHVEIGENAIVSGLCAVHQFVRIGAYCMIGGGSRVNQDIPPFCSFVVGHGCYGINAIGLRRSGRFSREEIAEIKTGYRTLYRAGASFREAIAALESEVRTPAGRQLVAFLRAPSKRGIVGPPAPGGQGEATAHDADLSQVEAE